MCSRFRESPEAAEAEVIEPPRPGTAGVPACPRRETDSISSRLIEYSWLGWARAGGDACGPRTIARYHPLTTTVAALKLSRQSFVDLTEHR